ncbi:Smr/MutS family protein, partial [Dissulfurirhabdus thermomarina]
RRAMEGVRPIRRPGETPSGAPRPRPPAPAPDEDAAARRRLEALVAGREPVAVEKTPEFVSGVGPGGDPLLVRRLHRGDFAVQAYCDLHGLDAEAAVAACRAFLAAALGEGRRCVAFIHGRGLSSPGPPVLKRLVQQWLSRGPFRRHVLAYCSAPARDGGAGVTYVLLRRRPAARRRGRGAGR